MIGKILGTVTGAVTAGVGSAVCCSGPIVAATLGFSGAGLMAWRPFRPLFVLVAVGFLWTGFYLLDREDEAACDPGQPCLAAQARARLKTALWLSTILVVLFGTSSRWLPWALG